MFLRVRNLLGLFRNDRVLQFIEISHFLVPNNQLCAMLKVSIFLLKSVLLILEREENSFCVHSSVGITSPSAMVNQATWWLLFLRHCIWIIRSIVAPKRLFVLVEIAVRTDWGGMSVLFIVVNVANWWVSVVA